VIILNNEEQDLDDIPTEEEELNLANILQTWENTRIQATKARKKVSILHKKTQDSDQTVCHLMNLTLLKKYCHSLVLF